MDRTEPSRGTAKTLRVFVVEDSPVVADRLVSLLEGVAGVEVVGRAEAAGAAQDAIGRLQPDLVTLDLQLADGLGFAVLDRAKHATPAPHVVVLTNHVSPQYRTRCLRGGADEFLDKATEFDRVVAVAERLLHG
jgi:DNA-binding NarL/FixJ family response regulator